MNYKHQKKNVEQFNFAPASIILEKIRPKWIVSEPFQAHFFLHKYFDLFIFLITSTYFIFLESHWRTNNIIQMVIPKIYSTKHSQSLKTTTEL